MTGRRIAVPGYKLTKAGKLEQIPAYRLNASARIAARKKVRISRRAPG
jgi:hypothetical protein